MASKSYILGLGLMGLVSSAAMAQRNDASADWWKDSSKVTTSSLPQYNEFNNNQYPYPAKPRDMWELSGHAGLNMLFADVEGRPGFGGGLGLRKSLGHVFSLRADYLGSISTGLDYRRRFGAPAGSPWAAYNNTPGGYFANFRNASHFGNLDLIASLNTLSYYRGNPKTNIYALIGYTLGVIDVDADARGNNNALYNFGGVTTGAPRSDIKNAIKNVLNGDYESNAYTANGNRSPVGRISDNQLVRHGASAGFGVAFKLSPRLSLGLEQRFTTFFNDELDGVVGGRKDDLNSYTALRAGLNLGNSQRRVAPLWWINPNNFIYNELNNPKHMKLPPPVLPDADGDGVTDQFDLEPSTPAGAPVDTHGVAKDTDGDGVPDFRDKEILTPNTCFPVNADGVGNCPEPACCKELRDRLANGGGTGTTNTGDCGIASLPSISFRAGSYALTNDSRNVLNSVAQQLQANPGCNVRVIGYGTSSKREQQNSYERVNSIIRYLVERQGISESRLIFEYGKDGAANTVDMQPTTETGPNRVPSPYPNLRKS